jgi:hypothetical protein
MHTSDHYHLAGARTNCLICDDGASDTGSNITSPASASESESIVDGLLADNASTGSTTTQVSPVWDQPEVHLHQTRASDCDPSPLLPVTPFVFSLLPVC